MAGCLHHSKAGTAIADRPMPQDEQAGSLNSLVPCAIKVRGLSALPFTAQFIPFAALPGSESARPALPGGARAQGFHSDHAATDTLEAQQYHA